MSIIRRNRLAFPSLIDDFFGPDWLGGMASMNDTLPAVNIKENEKDYELELAIPGKKKDDFNVEVDNNILTVSMETHQEDEQKEDNYTRKEFSYTSFRRSFTLPETVNEDKINANYKDGILRFTLPKKEEALPKPKRMIEIGK